MLERTDIQIDTATTFYIIQIAGEEGGAGGGGGSVVSIFEERYWCFVVLLCDVNNLCT